MPILYQALDAMTIPYVSVKGFEADDVMATLSVEARRNGYYTYICSRDKDLQQLLADDVVVLDIGSGKEWTCTMLKEKMGILPSQIPDMLALIGDRVDSIPGIPGIGPKTAAKLLQIYGNLENVTEHIGELSNKLGTTIREHCEQALVAKKVAILRTDVPIEVPFSIFVSQPPNKAAVELFLSELGFQALMKRFNDIFP